MWARSRQHQDEPVCGKDFDVGIAANPYSEAEYCPVTSRAHGVENELTPNLGTHGYGSEEAHSIEAVVDVLGETQLRRHLVEEVREQREHHEAVCDRLTEGAMSGLLRVDVVGVEVQCEAAEGGNAVLSDGQPLGHADRVAHPLLCLSDRLVEVDHLSSVRPRLEEPPGGRE